MSYKKNLIKANGFPTLYDYGCGNGMAEIVTQPNGEKQKVPGNVW